MRLPSLLLVACLLAPSAAHAAPITFTDRTSFEAAVGTLSLTTFDNPHTTVFNSQAGTIEHYYPDVTVIYDSPEIGLPDRVGDFSHLVTLLFPTPVVAFGFDVTTLTSVNPFMTWHTANASFTSDLASGFIGVAFEQPITGISLSPFRQSGGEAPFELDNLSVSKVAEPSTLSLFALATVLLVRRCRRSPGI
jgi:energy-converting hydrogenase Eha subunit A